MWNNFKHTLSRSRGQIIGWGLGLGLYGAYLAGFFDTLMGMSDQFTDLIEGYPPELIAIMGLQNPEDLFSPSGFLHTYIFSLMPLILGVLAIIAGSGLLVADEEDGVLDLILGHPVSRFRFFAGRLLAHVTAVTAIVAVLWIGVLIGTTTSSLELSVAQVLGPNISLLAVMLFFSSFALMASMLLPSRRFAAMATGVLLVVSFFLTMVGNLDPNLTSVAEFSPLSYYQGGKAIDGMEWGWILGLLSGSLIFSLVALWRFQAREVRVGGEGEFVLPRLNLRRRQSAPSVSGS
jgi:ABC-2 type transport system permease protein